jgi:hypothetical protein
MMEWFCRWNPSSPFVVRAKESKADSYQTYSLTNRAQKAGSRDVGVANTGGGSFGWTAETIRFWSRASSLGWTCSDLSAAMNHHGPLHTTSLWVTGGTSNKVSFPALNRKRDWNLRTSATTRLMKQQSILLAYLKPPPFCKETAATTRLNL